MILFDIPEKVYFTLQKNQAIDEMPLMSWADKWSQSSFLSIVKR